MAGPTLVNTLATLLVVAALFVVLARKPAHAALLYSLQSFILVCAFVAIAWLFDVAPLYHWAGTSFVTKTVLVPAILYLRVPAHARRAGFPRRYSAPRRRSCSPPSWWSSRPSPSGGCSCRSPPTSSRSWW